MFPSEPGIYRNIPESVYHASPILSRSVLVKMRRSPAHLLDSVEDDFETTDDLTVGTAIHTLLLEPHEFSSRFAIRPTEIKKRGTKAHDAFLEEIGDKDELRHSQYTLAKKVVEKALAKKSVRKLIRCAGDIESTFIWDDESTGIRLRSRPDKYWFATNGDLIVLDIKSTKDASLTAFAKSCADFNYHVQAAMYLDGFVANRIDAPATWLILALEKTRPFASAIYKLGERSIESGRCEYKHWLARYAECQQKNEWPDYGVGIQEIEIPSYRMVV